jgi:hypothetical protein
MHGLIAVETVEKEAIWTRNVLDCWHCYVRCYIVLNRLPSLHQLRQDSVYPLLSQILVIRLIYLHHRRGAAGAEALDGEEGGDLLSGLE